MERIWEKSYPPTVDYKSTIKTGLIHDMFTESARRFADNLFMNFLGKKYTYKETQILVDQLAAGLQALGVKKGVHVGLLFPNTPAYILFNLAILKAGGTIVNFNPLYAAEEILEQILDSEIQFMVTHDLKVLTDKLIPLLDKTPLKHLIISPIRDHVPRSVCVLLSLFKRSMFSKLPKDPRILLSTSLLKDPASFIPPELSEEDVAFLQYTGGTTGKSKGAMLTHANITANVDFEIRVTPNLFEDGRESVLAVLPFFHIFGLLACLYFPLKKGGAIIFIFPRFNADEAVNLIKKHKITLMAGVPTVYSALSKHPKVQSHLKTLKICISGADTLPLSTKTSFESASGVRIIEGYGLTEAAPIVSFLPVGAKYKENSAGLPVPGCEVALIDLNDHKTAVKPGELGEICVRGPQVMKGYWKRPEATKNVMIGDFLRTGDIGYMDEDGYIFIVDRAKDLIIVSGFNVYPRHVQDAIYKHPAVEETTVIGVADDYKQQHVKAFIKLKKDQQLTKDELIAFLKDKLSPIEMPKEVEFRDELPKTLIGKLSKKELVEEERRKAELHASAPK
jgi:long-chain acyl-CoA synthetase